MIRAALTAFIATLILMPVVQHLCQRLNIFDRPGPLKIHMRPVPRLGGVAIFFGMLAGIFAARPTGLALAWPLLAAISLIWIVGVVDDFRGAHPAFRLAAQLAASAVLWYGGWRFSAPPSGLYSLLSVCAFVVLCVNSLNFLDGSDGLAAGFSSIVALAYVALPANALSPIAIALACAMSASCAAFLPFNFAQRQKIFLGDSGSTTLGIFVAALGLDLSKLAAPISAAALFPFVLAALPFVDSIRVLLTRSLRRQVPTSGARDHFYDRWLKQGWSQRSVALMTWGLSGVCSAIGVLIVRGKISSVWSLLAFALASLFIGAAVGGSNKEAVARSRRTRAEIKLSGES
jgi:UDP-GlcNAc:undecaprenyl-phosphate GlcNAc-1-phosphate transferase